MILSPFGLQIARGDRGHAQGATAAPHLHLCGEQSAGGPPRTLTMDTHTAQCFDDHHQVTKVKGASQFAYSTEVSGMLPCLACCCQRRCCRPKARDVGPNDSAASMGSRNGNGASNKPGAGAGSGAAASVASGSKSDVLGSLRDVTTVVEEEGDLAL